MEVLKQEKQCNIFALTILIDTTRVFGGDGCTDGWTDAQNRVFLYPPSTSVDGDNNSKKMYYSPKLLCYEGVYVFIQHENDDEKTKTAQPKEHSPVSTDSGNQFRFVLKLSPKKVPYEIICYMYFDKYSNNLKYPPPIISWKFDIFFTQLCRKLFTFVSFVIQKLPGILF